MARWVSGVCAVAALLVAAGLAVMLVMGRLNAASQVAGVAGTVLSAAGLVVSVVAFFRTTPGPARRVRGGSVAVAGDANGAALGEDSHVVGLASARGPGAGGGQADVESGPNGIAVGGDANDAALGKRAKRTRS
ncbi:hypothetical protein OHB35_28580 [Streptomyces phaeochromogenes]|uniref:Uncharacterized protein n=1 Tax=Streptomyces phaeochromogenes TaxID=1923 RepID=A0ABZ1HE54_STRPH|nr:hypothetical protein [Streptomyces phaeochromogenes]WSD16887.1 hypothetical protein OHB35_28580 [Streptomyces phaeochromogenes]